MTRRWFWWLLTALWAGNIFYSSTSGFSSCHSASLLVAFFKHFDIAVSAVVASICNVTIRKFAHVFEYAVFTGLLYRAASGAGPLVWRPGLARWCVLAAAAYGITDELHQLFVPGRGASPVDWGFDCAGSLLAAGALHRSLRASPERASTSSVASSLHLP